MRALSASQAARCETATHPRCKCRCRGALHGANRLEPDELDQLPDDDPHHPGPPAVGLQLQMRPAGGQFGAAPR